jgi:hypothetical protein
MVVKTTADTDEPGSTRLTLVLHNDALTVLHERSEATGASRGKVASDLIREGQRSSSDRVRLPWVLPRRAYEPAGTTELVHRLQDKLYR